ncbi:MULTISPECIES: SMP-30/gluconolactonase/LRE family protein [unclassified Rhizobium]|uniref:SMP-30/gluconolactonase/LRE family protein n=1 Tax=unclassified Rhizobium TaxID=2613769 RepID=UPI00288BB18B|nr:MULTISPECIES: SMP-30/gluconolactonase/LRE family protein [unclassified Rhizobium]
MPAISPIYTIDVKNKLGESPVWSEREQKLYWVDSRGPTIYRFDPVSRNVESLAMPDIIGSIGLRSGGPGELVVAMQTGLHFVNFNSKHCEPIADPEKDLPDNRFNDGRTDRQGRFWSGTMSDVRRDPTGSLYRLDADRTVSCLRGDVIVPNSICWSPDSRVMYFADTYRDRIMAYRFDADAGTIHDERLFADTSDRPGRPDGSTVDADGYLWNAEYGGGRVVRYAPDGRINRVVDLPVTQPTSCAFGGPDLATLFVTSAHQRLGPDDLAAQPLAGDVFAFDIGIKGLAEPEYEG